MPISVHVDLYFFGDVVALDEVGAVAVETVGIPDLTELVPAFRYRRDLLPVDPPLRADMPEHRQHIDSSVGQRRQIALISLGTERVVDGEGFRRAVTEGNRNRRPAVLHAERVRAIVIGELRPFAEVTNHGGFRDRLGHLDVQRVRPLRVLDVVTLRAGGGSSTRSTSR